MDRPLPGSDPPRSKSLVMTIFGDAIAPHGGAVWLGSLIELLAPFGVNDRLLRTSVFRLAQEGWLVGQPRGPAQPLRAQPGAAALRARQPPHLRAARHALGRQLDAAAGAKRQHRRRPARGRAQGAAVGRLCDAGAGVLAHPARRPGGVAEVLARAAPGKLFVCGAAELPGVPRGRCRNWCAKAGTCRAWSPATAVHRAVHAAAALLARCRRRAAAGVRRSARC